MIKVNKNRFLIRNERKKRVCGRSKKSPITASCYRAGNVSNALSMGCPEPSRLVTDAVQVVGREGTKRMIIFPISRIPLQSIQIADSPGSDKGYYVN